MVKIEPQPGIMEIELYEGGASHLEGLEKVIKLSSCLLYTSPSPRDKRQSRMPSSA